MDYTNAKIYKIVNDVDDEVYIGSTCQPLSKRMAEHRASMKSKRDGKIKLYQHMTNVGVENCKILLVEETPCENIEQLRKIEGEYIRKYGTLNGNIAGRTISEWNRQFQSKYYAQKKLYKARNHENIHEKEKERYYNNKEQILQKQKENYAEMTKTKITCALCGGVHNKKNTPNHTRSKRHQQALENLNNINNVSLQTDN